ncbi:hypothetical protein PIB30_106444 [Stylosanthes scabra]|uniref:Uncharacterized protein n=1 Tax=Stylosanthes scabra TaxID=79078 RepID=A0ABU6RYP5_9FABA|nr:hypothetical protein [Stylosanthes scabra]
MERTTPVARYCRKPGRQPAGPHLSLRLTRGRIDSEWILHFKNQFWTLVNRLWLIPNRFTKPFQKTESTQKTSESIRCNLFQSSLSLSTYESILEPIESTRNT